MRKIIIALALAMSWPVFAQTNFRSITFEEAKAAAKKEKKLVFIDFYTDWCGPCKMMARETFPLKEVGDFMNPKYVCLKLNAEKEGKALATQYGVQAYPTFVILDETGKKLNELRGAMDGAAFIEKMKAAGNPDLLPERMAARYNGGERTPELVNNYAFHKMEQRKEEEGFQIVNSYYDSLTDAQRLLPENAFLFTRYTIDFNDPKRSFMVSHRNEFPATVKPEIDKKIALLYRTELITYFSGYRLRSKLYKEEEYQALKKEIRDLKLDPSNQYVPHYALIEGRLKCDDDAYMDLCVKEYDRLSDTDRSLLLINLPRLIETDDVNILKKMSKFIRSRLGEMPATTISLAARVLTTIEEKING